ncbi:MAG TPA: cupin domain-containing protein [Desulforhopalus sp.]|nr:cupin domain-containing protein [Desulforhopalus sp.]
MPPPIAQLIAHFGFKPLPVEGTLYVETWRTRRELQTGLPAGTAMIGMYCNDPLSLSCFHRLEHDETWHFYLGDPLILYLLHPDGSSGEVLMGPDVLAGQSVQYTVPAGLWQGGCLAEGGEYAVFGCTMAPGFTPGCFEAGLAERLIEQYPGRAEIIKKLRVNGPETRMPEEL